jgi:hypothetical protein
MKWKAPQIHFAFLVDNKMSIAAYEGGYGGN